MPSRRRDPRPEAIRERERASRPARGAVTGRVAKPGHPVGLRRGAGWARAGEGGGERGGRIARSGRTSRRLAWGRRMMRCVAWSRGVPRRVAWGRRMPRRVAWRRCVPWRPARHRGGLRRREHGHGCGARSRRRSRSIGCRGRRRQERQRVVVAVIGAGVADSEVQMRAFRGPRAGGAHRADGLAGRDALPFSDGGGRQVQVRGVVEAVGGAHAHGQPGGAGRAREADLTAGGG